MLDGILNASPLENNLPILGLLSDLARHAPMKATLLTLTNPASRAQVKSDQKYPPVIEMMCTTLKNAADPRVQLKILNIFETLCDCNISLVEEDAEEPFEKGLTHSVPSKEPLLAILTALIEILASASKYHQDVLYISLHILLSLTSHNYGLYHVKSCLENNPEALKTLLEHITSQNEETKEEDKDVEEDKEKDKEKYDKEIKKIKEDKIEEEVEEEGNSLSGLAVTFLENLISCKLPKRTLDLRVQQLSSLLSWDKNAHPLEKIREARELVDRLKSLDEKDDKEPIPEMLEPLLPTPEALLNQFSQRSIGTFESSRISKKIEVETSVLSENTVDLLALAAELLPADFNLLAEVQRLCSKAPPDDTTQPKSQVDEARDNQKQNNIPTAKTKQPFGES